MGSRSAVGIGLRRLVRVVPALLLCLPAGVGAARGEQPPESVPSFKAVPEVQALLDQGKQAYLSGKNELSATLYEQALSKARELKDRKGEAEALRSRGVVYAVTGQQQRALEYHQQALSLYVALGDKSGEAITLNNIAHFYSNTDQPQKALEYYQQALLIYHALGDKAREGAALRDIGVVYNATGQPQKALEYYQQALTIDRALGDKAGEGGTLVNIGLVYNATGQPQKALECYQQALPLLHAAGQRQFEANALNNIGIVYSNTGQPQKALEYYQQALLIYRTLGDKPGEGGTLVNIGLVYLNSGHSQKALEYYQQALPICRAFGSKLAEGVALLNIGKIYADTGQPQKALEYYQRALPLLHAAGQQQNEANALNNIGNVYSNTDQPQKALEYYQQALPIRRALGDKAGEGAVLLNIGKVYSDTGQPQKALEFDRDALSIFQAIRDPGGEAGILLNIGIVYNATGQPDKALQYYRQALTIDRALGNKAGEANALVDIGTVYDNTGQPDKALQYYRQALPIYRALGNKAGEGSALVNIGLVYNATGQPQKALEYYQRALPLLHAAGQRQFEANALNDIGNVYRDLGQPQKALEHYQQVLTIRRALGDKARESRVLDCIGFVETTQQNVTSAAQHYDRAIALTEQLRTNLGGYSEAKSRYLQSKLPLYYRGLRAHLRLHHEEKAFALAQQTKARVLLDLMASGRVDLSRDLTADERQQVQQLSQQADFLNRQMVKEGVENEVGAKKRFAALQQRLRQAESQLQTLTDTLYARHPTLAAKTVAKTATLADMAALLPADTALLDYVVTSPQQVALFVVRQHRGKPSLHIYALPISYNRLARQTAAFHVACADPRRSYRSAARQLYAQLVAPAGTALSGTSHLVICPDQTLWDVPFAALLASDGKFLADRYKISYAYSATGLRAAQALRSAPHRMLPTGSLLVLANPEFGEVSRFGDLKELSRQRPFDLPSRPFDLPSRPFDLPSRPFDLPSRPFDLPSRPFDVPSRPFDVPSRPFNAPSRSLPSLVRGKRIASLPGTQREADALARLFPGAAIFTGDKAQETVVKQEAGKYRYLHFATHGFCNDADPMLSSIVLAAPPKGSQDDGFLTARELSELNLSAEMVVLSACNTARGEERSGEGVIGLSWALLVAGCPTQVVSQWSVDDASTATLMADFYHGLNAGRGKAAALRSAAQKLRNDGKHAHPYYWAPFILIGDGR